MPVRLVRPVRPARSAARRRPRHALRRPLAAAALALGALGGLCGCGGGTAAGPAHGTGGTIAAPPAEGHRGDTAGGLARDPADNAQGDAHGKGRAGAAPAAGPAERAPALGVASGPLEAAGARVHLQLPGLGPATLARIPSSARQVLVVTGEGVDSPVSRLVAYRHTEAGWVSDAGWKARNARDGWTTDHYDDDLRSPVGVFGLTDAGGQLPDPGTRLPYDESPDFATEGIGFEGESLAHSFDYVIAINYNRRVGVSPLDMTRPLGDARGGGIWFHVDHGGPTHGCVSMSEEHMKELLRFLDPALHPVVVMGDAGELAR